MPRRKNLAKGAGAPPGGGGGGQGDEVARNRPDAFEGSLCSFCGQLCNANRIELARICCRECGWDQCHMPCLIKETTVRQRKALEEGVEPETEIPCPRVSER
eukprot:1256964-Rhodomonas_salina.3